MRHITLTGGIESAGRTLGGVYKDTMERIVWGDAPAGLPGTCGAGISRNMMRRIHTDMPDDHAFIEALADGAILDISRLFGMFSLELGRSFGPTPPVISVMVCLPRFNGDRTDTSTPTLGVIVDTVPTLHPTASLITRRPDEGPSWIELCFVPFAGSFLGINEKGLALALGLKPFEGDGEGVIPLSLSVRRALSQCSSAHDAATLLMETSRGSSGFAGIADKNTALILEFTPDAAELRTPDDAPSIIAAQHFLAPGMMNRDIPHDETYPSDAPVPLRYRRIYESSERRFEAVHDIMTEQKPLTGRDLTDIFNDKNTDLIMDGPYYHTLASAVLIPRRASVFLSTREDAGSFTRYGLND